MGTDGLYELVQRKAEQAGIENATVHRFRHTFALMYLQNGEDGFLPALRTAGRFGDLDDVIHRGYLHRSRQACPPR